MGEAAAASDQEVCGVLASLRRVSARLLFGDLERADGAGEALELVFKEGVWCARCPPAAPPPRVGRSLSRGALTTRRAAIGSEDLPALRRAMRQGDELAVRGVPDGRGAFGVVHRSARRLRAQPHARR